MLENVLLRLGAFIMSVCLGFYLITALQWFSYKFNRIIFHYTKPLWHLYFFILPLAFFALATFLGDYAVFGVSVIFAIILFAWQKKLDKKLVFTSRIKRFFGILVVSSICFLIVSSQIYAVILSLVSAFLLSFACEKLVSVSFKMRAKNKILNLPNLKIILITASFGKTSIKNFLYELLKDEFDVIKTPRSVNTLAGIIKDINENLSPNTQIYIVEAGARLKGDIKEISEFLNQQFVIVGEIGTAHLEYFKTIENIRATKLEALLSNRLKYAVLHSSTLKKADENTCIYDTLIHDISSNLDGIKFSMSLEKQTEFSSNLLGSFNAYNIAACVCMALNLGVNLEKLLKSVANLHQVEHRLQKIEAGGKLIIDDSFNGNFKGMSASYELVKSYKDTKVLLTPGIVEGEDSLNEELSKIINETFDIVVITSMANEKSLSKFLNKPEVIILKDKSKMTEFLAENTKAGDLILFSNDAPSFI
ncbi:D-alanyl-D-alanine-adding enzyme [Campylobacter iguaniorum]|uniref:Mur ligase family protein n=1 Tax=Campylobacter iguaniorum TaxID=1244531 RepID=UPI00073A4182|nr:UDP-N-acetylmuramoyl-tripeptide--D-alanyl-D-alanine ligase [Campylobacter iguaniorum]ALV24728.1 D-alanyl-D-alanine-adding enzyme [Campylobacter iguaniorum]